MRRRRKSPGGVTRGVCPMARTCMGCAFSHLMRSAAGNPVVSECSRSGERHVASVPHVEDCGFRERVGEAVIHGMSPARVT